MHPFTGKYLPLFFVFKFMLSNLTFFTRLSPLF